MKHSSKIYTGIVFAFLFAPAAESIAVTQVPMLEPSTIKNANSKGNTSAPTIAITTPVAAEELWIKAVKITPTKINNKGKLIFSKILVKAVSTALLPNA